MNENIASQVTQWFYPLMSLSLLLVASLKFSRSYWGKLLIAAAVLQLTNGLFWRITFQFRNSGAMEAVERLQPFFQAVSMYSEALILLALSSVLLARAAAPGDSPPPVTFGPAGRVSSVGSLLLLLPVTVNIYWMFWLHRVVKEIRQFAPEALKFTPGQAVGYMFIPIFNLYWFCHVLLSVTRAIGRLNEQFRARDARIDGGFSGGVVTGLMFLALLLNSLASFNFGFILVGEAIFLTCLGHTQRHLNQVWRAAALPVI